MVVVGTFFVTAVNQFAQQVRPILPPPIDHHCMRCSSAIVAECLQHARELIEKSKGFVAKAACLKQKRARDQRRSAWTGCMQPPSLMRVAVHDPRRGGGRACCVERRTLCTWRASAQWEGRHNGPVGGLTVGDNMLSGRSP
eukprot:scaffold7335_cov417-Prasinococcus_capsulatus_cf.AAC.8